MSELTQILMGGLIEDGGRILIFLWQPGPGQLAVDSFFRVRPFKSKKKKKRSWLLDARGRLKKASLKSKTVNQ